MDGNDQNRSVDGIKPSEPQTPAPSVDGIITNQQGQSAVDQAGQPAGTPSAPQAVDTQTAAPSAEVEVAKLKQQKKGMAVWLVVLLVILFAGIAAAAVYFWQANKAKSDLNAQKAQTAQAQKALADEQQSATQQQIDQLNADKKTLTDQNAALQKTVDAQTAYIKTLTDTANKLKTTCGTTCSSITIPAPPATSSTTTTN